MRTAGVFLEPRGIVGDGRELSKRSRVVHQRVIPARRHHGAHLTGCSSHAPRVPKNALVADAHAHTVTHVVFQCLWFLRTISTRSWSSAHLDGRPPSCPAARRNVSTPHLLAPGALVTSAQRRPHVRPASYTPRAARIEGQARDCTMATLIADSISSPISGLSTWNSLCSLEKLIGSPIFASMPSRRCTLVRNRHRPTCAGLAIEAIGHRTQGSGIRG